MKTLLILLILVACCGTAHAQRAGYDPACTKAYAARIPCILGVTDNYHWHSQALIPAPLPATMPWQGNTFATVETQFTAVILWEWGSQSAAILNGQVEIINDLDLARFAHFYWVESHGGQQFSWLMYYAATKLSPVHLVRWATAFGFPSTNLFVDAYAPPTIKAQYYALKPATHALIKQSHAMYEAEGKLYTTINGMAGAAAAPNVDMSLREIYSEYLFNGAETEAEAFAKMVKFAAGRLGVAWTAGYKAGSMFYAFAERIDPSYGYDLTTTYGDLNLDFGALESPVTGRGYLNDGDIVELTQW